MKRQLRGCWLRTPLCLISLCTSFWSEVLFKLKEQKTTGLNLEQSLDLQSRTEAFVPVVLQSRGRVFFRTNPEEIHSSTSPKLTGQKSHSGDSAR
ncbi:hypothetical protein Q5P01_025124 [Channa striata]|uniref:Uncharacterized protein n=1 Tax=Channa striata TaxID=64152 RepID=A0AA88IW55_CHASR|nr:hypothetical protein Q5P01_025124 [Channa striata]